MELETFVGEYCNKRHGWLLMLGSKDIESLVFLVNNDPDRLIARSRTQLRGSNVREQVPIGSDFDYFALDLYRHLKLPLFKNIAMLATVQSQPRFDFNYYHALSNRT
jgi:hypothetical protein